MKRGLWWIKKELGKLATVSGMDDVFSLRIAPDGDHPIFAGFRFDEVGLVFETDGDIVRLVELAGRTAEQFRLFQAQNASGSESKFRFAFPKLTDFPKIERDGQLVFGAGLGLKLADECLVLGAVAAGTQCSFAGRQHGCLCSGLVGGWLRAGAHELADLGLHSLPLRQDRFRRDYRRELIGNLRFRRGLHPDQGQRIARYYREGAGVPTVHAGTGGLCPAAGFIHLD